MAAPFALVTDQLGLGKTKVYSQFLILRLHCWYNKKLQTKLNITITTMANNNENKTMA